MSIFDSYPDSRLLGISGTLGAGKDTLAQHLVDEFSFLHVSTGDVLRAEATERGLDPHHRPTLVEIGVELRMTHGMGALSLEGVRQWQQRQDEFAGGLVISGLRSIGESRGVQEQSGTLIFIDGPPEVRYSNIRERGRQEGNFTTYEEFLEYEHLELHGLLGKDSPNLRGIQEIADIQIWNPGFRKEQYCDESVRILGLVHL